MHAAIIVTAAQTHAMRTTVGKLRQTRYSASGSSMGPSPMKRNPSTALVLLLITASLAATAPVAVAEPTCESAVVATICQEDTHITDAGCQSEERFEACWTTEADRRLLTATVQALVAAAGIVQQDESAHSTIQGAGEIGTCTRLAFDLDSYTQYHGAYGWAGTIGASASTGATRSRDHTTGTIDYDDPCGEDLTQGFLQTGNYTADLRSFYLTAWTGVGTLAGFADAYGYVFITQVMLDEASDPSKDRCYTVVGGYTATRGVPNIVPDAEDVVLEGFC